MWVVALNRSLGIASVLLAVCLPASLHAYDFKVDCPVTIDWSGNKTGNIFFLLGMLDDYGGRRWTEGDDLVERFYCSEQLEAYVFAAYLRRVAEQQGLDSSVVIVRNEGCLAGIRSDQLTRFIDSFHEFTAGGGTTTIDGERRRIGRGVLRSDLFSGHGRDARLAYLAGAYFRYGVEGRYKFANSAKKMTLIAALLTEVGCEGVETRSRWGLPANNEVFFETTEELAAAFARLPGEWSLAAADSIVGLASDEELAIYRAVIHAAQRGDFDNCPASTPCVVNRFSFTPYRGERGEIPDAKPWMERALARLDSDTAWVVSVVRLQSDAVIVVNSHSVFGDTSVVSLGRIGFDPEGDGAVILLSHYRMRSGSCGQQVAVFLKRRGNGWAVTNYSVKGKQRMPRRRRRSRRELRHRCTR
jgi:hypothetical protein